jgi:tRNA and rRNA cytosine-C5-methylases
MDFEFVSTVLASTLYNVKTKKIPTRKAFALTCEQITCSNREIQREDLYQLARAFISDFYKLKYLAEKSGKNKPSNRLLARLFLYLYFMDRGLSTSPRLMKTIKRDFPYLEKTYVGIEKWAKLSYPKWFYEKLVSLLSIEDAEKLLNALNKRVLWIRVNTLKVDLDKAVKKLEDESVEFKECKDIPFLLKVLKYRKPIRSLTLFKEGAIIPQDKASVLVVLALSPEPGMIIYDFAAAPGIKTSLIMQLTENKARVIALDSSGRRLDAMRKLLKLYGVDTSRVELVLTDSRTISLNKEADSALIDAPCSSSGAISRDPAIKIFLEKNDVVYKMKELQVDILYNALQHVDNAIYATCSLMPEEGEEVVLEVQKRGVEHEVVEPAINASKGYRKYSIWQKVRRTFPHVDESEGFFIARLER